MLLLSCFAIRMNIIMKSGKSVTEIIPGFLILRIILISA